MQIQFLIEVLPSGLLHPLTLANNPTTYTYYPLPKKEEEIAKSYIGDIRNDALSLSVKITYQISWELLSTTLRNMVLFAIVFVPYLAIILCKSSSFNLMKLHKIDIPLLHRDNLWSSGFSISRLIGRIRVKPIWLRNRRNNNRQNNGWWIKIQDTAGRFKL